MLGLADARKAAADAQFELVRGVDPNAARKAAKVEAAEAAANTVASICAGFLQREGRRLRTLDQRERLLKRLVYPTIGDRPVSSVKRSEIVRLAAIVHRFGESNHLSADDIKRAIKNWQPDWDRT